MAGLSDTLKRGPKEIELDGKKILIGEMDLDDWAAVERHAKQIIKQRAKEVKADNLAMAIELYPNDMPVEIFHKLTESKPVMQKDITDEIGSVECSTFLITRLVQKHNPSLKEKDILGMIKLSDINKLMDDIDIGIGEDGPKKKVKGEVKVKKRLVGHRQ